MTEPKKRSQLRISAALLCAATASACGGGGGGGSVNSVVPKTPSKAPGTATFSFKLPGKSTMAKLRRPYYVSQATQGVAIDWISTDPTHPDYGAAVSATCPIPSAYPAGVTNCTIDGQGNTDYTFALQIPAGTYPLTVSAFNAAPTVGGVFAGSMLAQGQLAAPITIVAGQNTLISGLTFYGVPASVSFVPAEAQSHVTPLNGGYAIVGNTPQTFYAQATDAEGFAISSSDSGAPAIAVAESAADPAQYLSVSGSANKYTVTAVQAAPSGTTPVIRVTATSTGTGLPSVSNTFNVTTVAELWTTQSSGGTASSYGLNGYALYPPSYTPLLLDFTYDPTPDSLCSAVNACSFEPAAAGPNGSIVAVGVSTVPSRLYEFTPASGSQPPVLPTAALPITSPSFSNVAADSSGHLFFTDNSLGTLSALSTPGATSVSATASGLASVMSVTVAPSTDPISALRESVWVGDGNATPVAAYAPFSGALTPIPVTFTSMAPPSVVTLGFDVVGQIWMSDGTYLYVYSVSGGLSGVTLTPLLASPYMPSPFVAGSSFGADVQGNMWLGEFTSTTGMLPLSLSSTPCSSPPCTVTEGNAVSTGAPVDAAFTVP